MNDLQKKVDAAVKQTKATTDAIRKTLTSMQERNSTHETEIDKRMQDLENRRRQQKRRAAAPPPHNLGTPFTNTQNELTLVVGGFQRDTPADAIENFVTKWIRQLPSGPQALEAGHARIRSPYFSSLVGHISISHAYDYLGRQLVQEGRGWQKQVKVGNIQIKPWIGVQKTAEERRRNRKLNALAKTMVDQLPMDHADKKREPWKATCWRSATMILESVS